MELKIINLHKIIYPSEYPSNYVYTHYKFNDELRDLIEKSGYVHIFMKDYRKILRFLENLKTMSICKDNKKFEKLLDADGLYSMKLKGEKNIRILFMFTKMDNQDVAILLTCFEEKVTSDYKPAIRIANERKKELTI